MRSDAVTYQITVSRRPKREVAATPPGGEFRGGFGALTVMPSSTTAAPGKARATGSKRPRRKTAWGKLIAFALVFLALAAAWRYTPLSEWITAESVSGWARAVREYPWAPLLLVLSYTPAAFVMFPRPVLTLITVLAFGPWLGFTYSMVGIMLSALATYYAGRVLKPQTVERLAGDQLDLASRKARKHGLMTVFAIRIVPAAPFALEGIVAGAIRIKVWDYALGTLLGMTPGVLATSVFGGQISAALEDPSTINWWLVGGVIVAFVALTWAVKRWFSKG